MNKNITYKIIDALSLKYAERKCSTFAGDVHIIFNKSKSSDKERFMEMVNYLIKDDRIMISDRNYAYNVFEFGNSFDRKKAYADKFFELCNDNGITTTTKSLPSRPRDRDHVINYYTNQ